MSAAPWILLRGLTRDARHWGGFAAALREREPDARIIALDLPGNGLRYREPSAARVEDAARECRAQLKAQGLSPPYRLLAMSLGAMVAVAWAQQAPEELKRCVLINTSLRPYSRFYQRLRPRQYPRLLGMVLRWHDAPYCEQRLLHMTSRRQMREVLADWCAWRSATPVSRANAWRQLHSAMRFMAPREAPSVPMLLLAGARDALVNPDCSRRLAQAWHLPLIEHPDAGHDLPLDDPAWVLAQL
ncbi:Lysophospholipase, alpha-beta hydrolase superfamily [Solimonas aquatica]|uniref:Lysophospholipase, alpha-beta hydrolase superfamily n=1 Tax=Solimonas aquatica TaxID=489703 RepID=A0A1H9LRL4_9GAMM|nr:alpha/beta hydrolase [Solimonas aquatica]SER13909.1 Lysophospholipase, alpha-beta hydrolase superfamily [Solimonas aquatica]